MFFKIIVCLLVTYNIESVQSRAWSDVNRYNNSEQWGNPHYRDYFQGDYRTEATTTTTTTTTKPLYPTLYPNNQPKPYDSYPQDVGQRQVPVNPFEVRPLQPLQPNTGDDYNFNRNRNRNNSHGVDNRNDYSNNNFNYPYDNSRSNGNDYPNNNNNSRDYVHRPFQTPPPFDRSTQPTNSPTQFDPHSPNNYDNQRYNPLRNNGNNNNYNNNNYNGYNNSRDYEHRPFQNPPQFNSTRTTHPTNPPTQNDRYNQNSYNQRYNPLPNNGNNYPNNNNNNYNNNNYNSFNNSRDNQNHPFPNPQLYDGRTQNQNQNRYNQQPNYGNAFQSNSNVNNPNGNVYHNSNLNDGLNVRSSFNQVLNQQVPQSQAPQRPDYDPNGVALAPFPDQNSNNNYETNKHFNYENLYRRQPSSYQNVNSRLDTSSGNQQQVPLAGYGGVQIPLAPL